MAEPKLAGDVKAALGVGIALVCVASAVDNTGLTLAFALPIALLAVYVMSRVPVRRSLLALMFLAFTLQNPAEGNPTEDQWSPPFHKLGAIMLTHLNAVDRSLGFLSWCSFSGMDLCFLTLSLVLLLRRSSGSRIDSAERLNTPRPLIKLAQVSLLGGLYVLVSGAVRGGDFSMSLWQLNSIMYLPIVFLLFQVSLRGPQDHRAIAKVVLAAATYKAVLAFFVMHSFQGPLDLDSGSTQLPYATTHADSILFADAFILILAGLLERLGKRMKWIALALLPILAAGMISNNRRLVWVQVALVFLTVYVVSEPNSVKRFISRTLLVLAPIIVIYCAAGWNSNSPMFKPARMMRSVVDPQTDGSSLWRELENFDLITTFRNSPILGTGFGHPYEEYIPMPAVAYTLERYVPHNGILGLWCYCGYFGYAAVTMLWAGGIYFAMRAYHATKIREHRAAALVTFGAVLVYMVQSWGDLGLGSWSGVFSVGAAIAIAGKLCVANGQWPSGSKGTAPNRSAAPPPAAPQWPT
jgi:hypothetical protein